MTIANNDSIPHNLQNGFSTFIALLNGSIVPGHIWRQKSYRAKFLLRSLIYPRQTLRLFGELIHSNHLPQLLATQTTFPSKIHRHYSHLGMSAAQRVDAITSHYQFLDSLASRSLAEALLSGKESELFTLEGKNGETIVISASTAQRAEREGESTLWLRCDNCVLAALTFCVARVNGQWEIIIGGLQGAHRSVPHEAIKEATKACYGLFPKRLLMEVVWQLAQQHGINKIYGVSDHGHVFRGLRYRLSKGKLFHASYNEFWESINGVKYDSHLFALPLSLPQKALEEIPSKKRSEYRKRYALLDSLQQGVAALS